MITDCLQIRNVESGEIVLAFDGLQRSLIYRLVEPVTGTHFSLTLVSPDTLIVSCVIMEEMPNCSGTEYVIVKAEADKGSGSKITKRKNFGSVQSCMAGITMWIEETKQDDFPGKRKVCLFRFS